MADPILVTPGQIVSPPDWDALLLQHGNLKSSVQIPITDPSVQQLITANPSLAKTLHDHPIYRYYMADGSYVEAYGQENGEDVQIVDYKPSQKFQQAQAQAQRATAAGTGDNPRVPAGSIPAIEGTPIPGHPGQYDNSQPIRAWHTPDGQIVYEPLTPQEVQDWRNRQGGNTATDEQPVPNRPGWTQITTKTGNSTKTQFRGPDGNVVDTLPAEQASAEQPVPNHPGWTQITTKIGNNSTVAFRGPDGKVVPTLPAEATPGTTSLRSDGKGGTVAVTIYPDGRAPTIAPVPGVPSEAITKYTQTKQDPNTGTWYGLTNNGWEAMPGQGPGLPQTGTPPEPAGAPPRSTQYGAVTDSLVRYRDFLNTQVTGKQTMPDGTVRTFTPTLTPDQADRLMQARLTDAKATMDEQQNVVDTQRGIFGSQVTQRGNTLQDTASRRASAVSTYGTVLQQFMPLLRYMPKGGGQAFVNLLEHGMGTALNNAQAWGGLRESPEIPLGPAAATANAAPMPGTRGTFLQPTDTGEAAAAAVNAASPAIGPADVGSSFLAPAGFDPAAAAAAEAARQASSAQVAAQNAQTPQTVTNAASGTIQNLLSPQPPVVVPPAVQNAGGGPGEPPSRGNLPAQPVSFLQPYQQPRPSGLQQMIQDNWMPNSIVAQAYQQVYGAPMVTGG